MICTTIQNRGLEEIFSLLDDPELEMAEIRLDRCPLDLGEIDTLFSCSDTPLVATCRISPEMPATEAESRLIHAIQAGAAYVDVELEAPAMMSKRIRREANEYGTVLVRSFHDFEGTDSTQALKALVEKCQHLGAGVAKIVTTARTSSDVDKVMALYDCFEPSALIAFCMGEEGRNSRLECLRKGAPYTYAAMNAAEAAAPGQWEREEMYRALYGERKPVGGETLRIPASKSFAQRAIVAAALARGRSVLHGYSSCGDSESAISAAKALGARVAISGDTIEIEGIDAGKGRLGISSLHTGESGFLTRMMIPLMACLPSGPVHISGEKTLVNRPLKGASGLMEAFGVKLVPDVAGEEVKVPLTVRGPLVPGKVTISGKDGSQLISGLLAALPLADRDSEIHIDNPKSIPYIYITIDVLKKFGIHIESEMEGGEEFFESHDWSLCDGMTIRIRGGQCYKAAEMDIEADWSSAAAFIAAGAIFGSADLEGLDTSSLQADLSMMDILTRAGASMSQEEESGIIHIRKAPLAAFDLDASNCPDLFPVVSVLAAFCSGTSHISGVGRLASKESDRGKAILDMLTGLGVNARIKGDSLIVHGMSLSQRLLQGKLLHGGDYTSSHDHRMVMALMVASLGADGPVNIDDTACVAKSFPDFMETFKRFAR